MSVTPQDQIAMSVVDKWLRHRIDHSDLPGAQVCIRKDGECLLSAAYGKANLATGEAFTTGHLSHIASHSKMFASCAVLMLVVDGKLRLDQPVVEIVTELNGHKDARIAEVTIRDVVSNRSGLFRDGVECDFWNLETPPFADYRTIIADILASDLVYEPNTKTKYSNWGFSLLGLVVERASGQDFNSFARERIVAKIPGAEIVPDWDEGTDRLFATGYGKPDATGRRRALKHKPTHGMAAATGFCANAESATLFLHTLLFTDTLLPHALRRELLHLNWPVVNSKTERYGLGLQFEQLEDLGLVGHSGGFQGFYTITRHWIGTGYIASVLMNTHEQPLPVCKAVFEIIEQVGKVFPGEEANAVSISETMVNRWASAIFAVGEKKAVGFTADSWLPCFAQPALDRKDDGSYASDKIHGYSNTAEPVRFHRGEAGDIVFVRHGSGPMYTETEYTRLSADTLAE